MEGLDFSNIDLAGKILDAVPGLVFIVGEDVQILAYNRAAGDLIGTSPEYILKRRGGDVLHCLHSIETKYGCGRAPLCRDCVVRNSVGEAFRGQATSRRHLHLELTQNTGVVKEFFGLVTVSPFSYHGMPLALLIIEDINELIELRRIVPICMRCRKVREDKEFWTSVEDYFNRHLDIDFSHGLCPDCFREEAKKMRLPSHHPA